MRFDGLHLSQVASISACLEAKMGRDFYEFRQ
jgi:hypothetical protein